MYLSKKLVFDLGTDQGEYRRREQVGNPINIILRAFALWFYYKIVLENEA